MDDAYYNNANNGDDGGVYDNNADADGNDDGNMDGGAYYNNVNGVNGTTDISFDSYVVTTVNPGIYLLAFTLGVCFICFVIGYFSFPGKCLNRLLYKRFKRKKDKSEEDGDGSATVGCAHSVELKPLGEDNASQNDNSSHPSGSAWKETIDFVIGYFSFPDEYLNWFPSETFKRKRDESEEGGDGSVELKTLGEDDASQNDDPSCYYKDMSVDEDIIDVGGQTVPLGLFRCVDLAVNNADRIPSGTENVSGSAWKETIDKDTGKTFYYDTNTLESTWIRPEALGKEKRRVSRLTFLNLTRQKRWEEDQKNLASKERVYLQTLGRQRSMARKKVSMRANEEDNLLRWEDFFRVFEFQDQVEARVRPQSAPAKINHHAYALFDDITDTFEENPNLTIEENDMNKRVWKETRKIIGLGAP